tara:strand:+ start:62 stop:1267 length:1206 start_codon:yes stop_codon:yes gene_type:complete
MALTSKYDSNRKADLKKQSARGKSIARRGKDIKAFRASLPRGADPVHPLTFRQKEYTYSPNWRDAGSEQLRKKVPGDDAKKGWFGGLGRDASTMRSDLLGPVKEFGPVKDFTTMVKDVGGMFKFPGLLSLLPQLGAVGENIEQNEENEEILGDAYSDEVRKEMMSPSDREFYDKYMRLASFASGKEAEKYRKTARTALENAQVTRRVNYALGDLGFDTSAEAGVAAFGEDKPVVDYGTLSGRLQSGLQGTKGGREFLSDVIPKAEALEGTGIVGDAAARAARINAIDNFMPAPYEEFISASPEEVTIGNINPFPDDDYMITTDTPFESWADEPQNPLTPEDITDMWSISDILPGLAGATSKYTGLLPQNLEKPLEEMTALEAELWAAQNPAAAYKLGWNPY